MKLKEHIRKVLNEVLTLVDDDVELLYDMFFKKDIEEIRETGIVRDDMFKRKVDDTSILQTRDAIKANGINPCAILVNYVHNGYQPSKSNIYISVNENAKNFVLDDCDGNIEIAAQELSIEHLRINLPLILMLLLMIKLVLSQFKILILQYLIILMDLMEQKICKNYLLELIILEYQIVKNQFLNKKKPTKGIYK